MGRVLDLRLKRSRVRLPALRFQVITLGKLFTHNLPLSPSSIIRYQSRGGDANAAGKVTVGQASHWPCVTDFRGLSTDGLTA